MTVYGWNSNEVNTHQKLRGLLKIVLEKHHFDNFADTPANFCPHHRFTSASQHQNNWQSQQWHCPMTAHTIGAVSTNVDQGHISGIGNSNIVSVAIIVVGVVIIGNGFVSTVSNVNAFSGISLQWPTSTSPQQIPSRMLLSRLQIRILTLQSTKIWQTLNNMHAAGPAHSTTHSAWS